jgi:Flp pilus assembly secretin CpaC
MRRAAWWSGALVLATLPAWGCGGGEKAEPTCEVLQRNPLALVVGQPQVQIEVRLITVESDFLNGLGIPLDTANPVVDGQSLLSGGSRCGTGDLGVASDLIGGPDGAVYGLAEDYAPGGLMPLLHGGAFPPAWNDVFAFLNVPGPDAVDVAANDREVVTNNPYGLVPPFLAPAGGEAGYDILSRLLDPAQVDLVVDAIAANAATRDILAAPQLSVFDGQSAALLVGEPAVAGDLTPDFQAALQTFDTAPLLVSTGVTIGLRTRLSVDNRTIRLEIFPEIQGASAVGGTLVDVNGLPHELHVPILRTSTVSTTVTVPDGGTILLGGIQRPSEAPSEGVPTLRTIPYLGALFRRTNASNATNNLMVMITPRIVGAP